MLNYTLGGGAALGVIDHVYSMSYPEGVALVQAGLKVELRIWVDDEAVGETGRRGDGETVRMPGARPLWEHPILLHNYRTSKGGGSRSRSPAALCPTGTDWCRACPYHLRHRVVPAALGGE